MKPSLRPFWTTLTIALLFSAAAVGGEEVDLAGSWTMTMEGESPSGQETVALTFERDGHNLAATMMGKQGKVECRGYIDGNRLRFYYIRPTEEGEFVAKYTGHVAGDLMGGEVDMGEQGKTKWRATRGPDKGIDLAGEWTMTMEGESPSGEESVKLTFRQEGPSLAVTMASERGEVDCEGWIEGNALRFYYIRPTAEGEFVAKYTGHIGGDLMGGEVDLGQHGKTAWKATRNP
jgi:hypothetical protein